MSPPGAHGQSQPIDVDQEAVRMLLALLVALVAALALVSVGVSWQLSREVRRLRADVRRLSVRSAAAVQSTPPAGDAEPRSREVDTQPDGVLTPTPIGPRETEAELATARIASVTLATPLVKVVAFGSGVRRALLEESRLRVGYAFRKELRRQRKVRRRRNAGPPREAGWAA